LATLPDAAENAAAEYRLNFVNARRFSLLLVLLPPLLATSCVSRVSYSELAREYYNLGNAFFELGDYERSFQYYSRAADLDTELPATGYNLARLHTQRGDYDQALEVIRRLVQSDPGNSLYLETEAYIHYRAGNTGSARRMYQTLIEEYPGRTRLRYNLALLELDEDRPGAARELLLQGIDSAGDDPEYLWLLAEASYADDDPDAAAAWLDRYRTLVADTPESLGKLARRYAQWDYALAALDVLNQIEPTVQEDPALLFLEGRLLMVRTADFETGLERVRSALSKGFKDETELKSLLKVLRPEDKDIVRKLYDEFDVAKEDTDDLPIFTETAPGAEP